MYILVISGGNETWSTSDGPVAITDSSQPVEVEEETRFVVNTDYTATVTVFTDYANMTSSQNFSEPLSLSHSHSHSPSLSLSLSLSLSHTHTHSLSLSLTHSLFLSLSLSLSLSLFLVLSL